MRRKGLVFGVALILLSGCETLSPYAGLSLHPKSLDQPEVDLSTGLGFFGAEYQHNSWEGVHVFCEHISGLQTTERGIGLNHCGIKLRK